MGIISRLFEKQINLAIEQKAKEVLYSGEEQYFKAIYQNMLTNGMLLKPDPNQPGYIEQGFEGNVDIYSILMRIITQASQVEWEVYDKRTGEEVELEDENHPLVKFLKSPNNYQTFTEFYQQWHLYHLATGNGIVYYPTYKEGNSKGQLMQIGAYVLPTQYVEIESGGFLRPIKNYVIDYNILAENKLPVEDVIHTRMPSLSVLNGQSLMGMSPIKVAANVVQMQNSALKRTENMYRTGMAPGIVSRVFSDDMQNNTNPSKESADNFNKNWKKKSEQGIPLYGYGKHEYIKLGTDVVRDMEVIENYQNGLRILCNIYGVPSQLFNDNVQSTQNNLENATKSMWINRIIPDQYAFCEKLNQKIQVAFPGFEIWPCYDKIPELQKNKKELSDIYMRGYELKLYTVNEVREKLDDDKIEGGHGDSYYSFSGNVLDPLSDPMNDQIDKVSQALSDKGINDYK